MNYKAQNIPILPAFGLMLLGILSFVVAFFLLVIVGQAAPTKPDPSIAKAASALRVTEQAVRLHDFMTTEAAKPVSFSQDVLPILQQRCVLCHGPNSIAGAPPNGLQLDTYEHVMKGSLFLPVVQAGNPDASSLILLLRSGGMPAQSDPLPPNQIDLIARWITQGALNN